MQDLIGSYRELWREPTGTLPNSLAILYGIFAHIIGLYLMAQGSLLSFILGVLLCGHSLVICAYLVHEAAHMTLFKDKRNNQRIGELMLWIVGAGYASFDRVRHMHLRHHQDRADVSCFDYQSFLQKQPEWLKTWVIRLERCYIPAVELIMHAQVIVRPFKEKHLRQHQDRVIWFGISRLCFFALLFSITPWLLVGYALAYWIMLQALFLADAFAHTYDAFFVKDPEQDVPRNGRDGQYDEEHTYSNLISEKYPWLNLLNLNFGYHTAHHEKASVAWHDLPAFHKQLYGDGDHPQILPYRALLLTLHKNRTKRIFVEDYGYVGEGENRGDTFIGAHGVSFLSII